MFYHIYIEYEICNLSYNTIKCIIYDSQFVSLTMGKWDDGF